MEEKYYHFNPIVFADDTLLNNDDYDTINIIEHPQTLNVWWIKVNPLDSCIVKRNEMWTSGIESYDGLHYIDLNFNIVKSSNVKKLKIKSIYANQIISSKEFGCYNIKYKGKLEDGKIYRPNKNNEDVDKFRVEAYFDKTYQKEIQKENINCDYESLILTIEFKSKFGRRKGLLRHNYIISIKNNEAAIKDLPLEIS